MELANRESKSSLNSFIKGLRRAGLSGVIFVVSNSHEGGA
ncbi:MAG: hypothetical protein AAF485_16835 [Chloroflexota bacterium]